MTESKSERLKAARAKAGFRSAQEAAERFGWGVSGYRHHENGIRSFGPDAAKKYARAFNVKPGWLLCIAGIDDGEPTDFTASEKLLVGNAVAAGVWREPSEDYPVVELDIPPPVRNRKRLGYVVEGFSMDLHYEPGTILDCVSIFTNGVSPETGDHVIVERRRPDGLRELTVKEYVRRGQRHFLVPKSTKPEFQTEIEIGEPSEDASFGDDEISVIAYVVSSISPRSQRLLDRMGKVRKI